MHTHGGFVTRITHTPPEGAATGGYPYSIPTIATLQSLELSPTVTFFVGENGSGKSTLLEAIAVAHGLNPEGGSRNFTHATRNSHSSLHESLTLVRHRAAPRDAFFLRAESFFTLATNIEEMDKEPGPGGALLIFMAALHCTSSRMVSHSCAYW